MYNIRHLFRYILLCIGFFSAIIAQALDLPIKEIKGKEYYYYKVQPKETIYSISHKLGINKNDIIKFNPSTIDGLRAYDILYFPVSEFMPEVPLSETNSTYITHKVKGGETVYGISRKYNISTNELIAHNPSVKDGLKSGEILSIPVSEAKDLNDSDSDIIDNKSQNNAKAQRETLIEEIASEGGIGRVKPPQIDHINTTPVKLEDVVDTIVKTKSEIISAEIKIAVMLPFMLDEPTPSRQAQLFTEFYKGLLIGVESAPEQLNIKLFAYDTADSLAFVKSILASGDLNDIDVIIAPNDDAQFNEIARFAQDKNCYVLNVFDVKNNSYISNSQVLQTLIPHEMMYDKAIEYFMEEYETYTPVFLKNLEKVSDKAQFVSKLKTKLDAANRNYREINYNDILTEENIARLDSTKSYVFVSASGSRSDLSNIIHMLGVFHESCPDANSVRLFGYPEWVTFKGQIKDKLHKFNTSIYSRFKYGVTDIDRETFENEFKRWYGVEMISAAPQQGLLGYDTIKFIIGSFQSNDNSISPEINVDGLQNCYDFIQPQGCQGFCNDVIYIINYTPDGETSVEKR